MSGHTRITDKQARDILARAAEIDRAQSQLTTVDSLRAAAREAGIADSAFDEALMEIQRVEREPAVPAVSSSRRRTRLVMMLLALAVMYGILMSRFAPSERRAPEAPGQAAPARTAPAAPAAPAPEPVTPAPAP